MAVIRQRRKNIIIAAVMGAVAMAVPLILIIFILGKEKISLDDKLEKANKELNSRTLQTVNILGADGEKGNIITENDLIECKVYVEDQNLSLATRDELVGKELKVNIKANTPVSSSMVCEQENMGNDVRLQEFSNIELNSGILEGSYIDVRISFPNGEDYIVAFHKKVIRREEENIMFYVSEEDILMLSSATVDMETYEGARVYAILYARDYQEAAKRDYPANFHVCELANWDPNLLEKVFNEQSLTKRQTLEKNMNEFLNDEKQK